MENYNARVSNLTLFYKQGKINNDNEGHLHCFIR
jgi:hypothetical protein